MNTASLIRTIFLPSSALLSATGILPAQNVSSNSDYVNALTSINSAVTGGTGNSYALEFNSGLTVTPGTGAFINAGTGNAVSIDGHGGTLSGGNSLTPVVIFSGAVNMSNLTIANGFGKGGTGTWSGGGGAGLGGGLFIATSSVVTLNNVSVTGNSTEGGFHSGGGAEFANGGNASFVLGLTNVDSNGVPTTGAGNAIAGSGKFINGSAFVGTSAGGQQSLSYIAGKGGWGEGWSNLTVTGGTTGSIYDGGGTASVINFVNDKVVEVSGGKGKMGGGDGSATPFSQWSSQTSTAGGGGGLVGGGGVGLERPGSSGGGFGGGGGGTRVVDFNHAYAGGGGGGFGGGGGGTRWSGGGGGFGGAGGSWEFRGDSGWGANYGDQMGASLGGGIFVMFGAELTITGSSTFSGNSGHYPYWDGDTEELGDLGSDLFVMTGGKATLAPGAGHTIRFQGTIDDDSTAQKFVNYSDGGYGLVSNGAGARIKIGSNSNPGGTVVFEGRTDYAGGTEMASGTLSVDGNTARMKSGSNLVFSGTSEFRYDNTNSSASADKTQTFGTLAFQDGEGR